MYRVALVVGINTYSKLNSLGAAARDAEAIAKLLENLGFEVRRLPRQQEPDGRITVGAERVFSNQLTVAIKELLTPKNEKKLPDTVLLYFSGHGTVNDLTGEGFLAGSDANPTQGNYGFSLRSLQTFLRDSKVKQQIVWLDCCYSGELLNLYEADPGFQGEVRDRCFIAAAYDEAFELLGGHSALTWVLLKALNPENYLDGWITNLSLVNYLNGEIKRDPQLRTIPQRPTYANFGGAIDFTLNYTPLPEPSIATICPYKGLSYFDFNDEDPKYFYGRTNLVSRLLERVQRSNFLAVLGASGSGKSSVVRAGLLHELKQGLRISGSGQWTIRLFRPGPYPLERLAQSLVDSDSRVGQDSQLIQIHECLKEGGKAVGQFIQTMAADRIVLAIDQFEEVFTQCQEDSQRQVFLECLIGALDHSNNKLCLLLVMRSDALEKCTSGAYAGLASKFQEPHLVPVLPMNPEELERAIAEPARKVGAEVEPNLLKQILKDMAGSSSNLPLLQYTLTELWQKRSGNRLTLGAYIELGGVTGTLEKRANEVYDGLLIEEQDTAKRIFLALTQDGEGEIHTRKTLPRQALLKLFQPEELVERVIHKLTNRNLLVTSGWIEKSAGADGETATVEVAHEELIRSWSKLRDWVNENRDARHKQQSIEKAAEEWRREKKPRDRAFLLQGIKLEAAEEYLKEHLELLPLTPLAREFIQISREVEDARQQRELEQERLLREEAEARAAAEAKARESEQGKHEAAEELQRQQLRRLEEQVEAKVRLQVEIEKRLKAAKARTRAIALAAGLAIALLIAVFGLSIQQQQMGINAVNYAFGIQSQDEVRQVFQKGLKVAKVALDEAANLEKSNEATDQENALRNYRIIREKLQNQIWLEKRMGDVDRQQLQENIVRAEDGLTRVILDFRISELERIYLGDPKVWGKRNDYDHGQLDLETDLDRVFAPGALKETYKIIMLDTGADVNRNGLLDNYSESDLIPCPILKAVEEKWQAAERSCSWVSGQTDDYPPCKPLGKPLVYSVFGYSSDINAKDRLIKCNLINRNLFQ